MKCLNRESKSSGAILAVAIAALAFSAAAEATSPKQPPDAKLIARGKYLVTIAGCNDCHTPGYLEAPSKVPERVWLTGDKLGWRGPWGTTYPTNLRLTVPAMTEKQWLTFAKTMEPRPPMPWFNVRAMSDHDLIALYVYMKSLGPAGEPAPPYLPPGKTPAGPYVQFPQ